MSISINYPTKVISVLQAYLSDKGGGIYEMDIDKFRKDLRGLEASEEGMLWLPTHEHFSEVVLSGATYSRMVVIINGYTITFEDGQYAVNAKGANSNIADVMNVNQVSLRSFNAAGLITVTSRRYRTQAANRNAAVKRLYELLTKALEEKAPRKKTLPTYASKQIRLKKKRQHSLLKSHRAKKHLSDEGDFLD